MEEIKQYGFKGRHHSESSRKKISKTLTGKKRTDTIWNKGKKLSLETRKKMSESKKGDKTHLWKGGITPINLIIRTTLEYRLWRESVLKRDNWTCRFCGKRGGNLNADHIKPFALFPELRFAIDNGRTLCVPCHRTTDTYGNLTNLKKHGLD